MGPRYNPQGNDGKLQSILLVNKMAFFYLQYARAIISYIFFSFPTAMCVL